MADLIVQETHQIKAGSQFDEQVPSTGQDLKEGDLVYAPDTQGGLFRLPTGRDSNDEPVLAEDSHRVRRVLMVRVKFGGQTSWTLKIVDAEGNEITWLAGTTEASLVVTDQLELGPLDTLKLETTGASTAMAATIAYDSPRRAS